MKLKWQSERAFIVKSPGKFSRFDSAFTFLGHGLSSQEIYAMRGMLICLVVLGHIPSDSQVFEACRRMIYNFHVYVFFMISMLHTVPSLTWTSMVKAGKRYLLPVFVMSGVASLLFNLVVEPVRLSAFPSVVFDYVKASLTGNAFHFNTATGLEIFWFMYALFGLTTIRMIALRFCATTTAKMAFLMVCAGTGWIFVILIPHDAPAFVGISTYVLPFAVICFSVVCLLSVQSIAPVARVSLALIAFAILSIMWTPSHSYNLAHLRAPVPSDILPYLTHAGYVGLAFFIIMKFAQLSIVQRVFALVGQRSLGIYLSHMFFLYPIATLARESSASGLMKVGVIFAVVMVLSFVFSRLFLRS